MHDQGMRTIRRKGFVALTWMQYVVLVFIAISTVFAMGEEVRVMLEAGKVTLADLLLMFIYLEVFAMIESYLSSGKLPVRMPLYIAIVALARYLILDMKNLDHWQMIGVAITALLLAATVFIIRFGHIRFPYPEHREGDD